MRRAAILTCLLFLFTPTLPAGEKPVITILDFSTNSVAEGDMRSIVSLLSVALFETDYFTVIDIGQRDTLLEEIQFSAGDCSDEACQLEIGRQLAAEMIVVGDLGLLGSKLTVTAKVLETATGKTLRTASGIYASMDLLVDDLYGLAAKLAGETPGAGDQAAGYDALLSLADNRTSFDQLWGEYLTCYAIYRKRMALGIAAAAGGAVLSAVGLLLAVIPQRQPSSTSRVSVVPDMAADGHGVYLSCRLRYQPRDQGGSAW